MTDDNESRYWKYVNEKLIPGGLINMAHARRFAQVGSRKEWAWASHFQKLQEAMRDFVRMLKLEPGDTLAERKTRLGITTNRSYYAYNLIVAYRGPDLRIRVAQLRNWLGDDTENALSDLSDVRLIDEWMIGGERYVALVEKEVPDDTGGSPASGDVEQALAAAG